MTLSLSLYSPQLIQDDPSKLSIGSGKEVNYCTSSNSVFCFSSYAWRVVGGCTKGLHASVRTRFSLRIPVFAIQAS